MSSSNSHQRPLWVYWIPAIIAVAVIMGESTDTMSAENTSRWLYPIWSAVFGRVSPDTWAEIHHLIRKTGHFIGYGLVSLSFYYSWRMTLGRNLVRRWRERLWHLRRRAALLALACTLAIASGDEYHQRFLPDRTSSIYDVGIDLSGGITMQLLLFGALALFARPRRTIEDERISVA